MAKRALPRGLRPATLTDSEACGYVGVSLNTFKKLRKDGLLPKPRRANGRNLNVVAELDNALAALPVNDGERRK